MAMASTGDDHMSLFPTWLTELFPISSWTNETYGNLHRIFVNDFQDFPPSFQGATVWHYRRLDGDKEEVFWHITSMEDKKAGERLPDLRRCERIRWIRCIIENSEQPEVRVWDYRESNGSIHTYLWLHSCDFVVILKNHSKYGRFLLTAFCVHESTKRNLNSKFEKRIKTE